MKLSIVMPIYNKEKVVFQSVTNVLAVLDSIYPNDYELIGVNDGSKDKSWKLLKLINHPALRKVNCKVNGGKGSAIRKGIAKAKGEYIGYIDCGLDISAYSLVYAIEALAQMPDAVVASRFVDGSIYHSNLKRKIFSKGFITLRKALFAIPTMETQSALQIYKGDIIKKMLPELEEERWVIELEILQLFTKKGFLNFIETPVIISFSPDEPSESAHLNTIKGILVNMIKLSLRVGRLSWLPTGKQVKSAMEINLIE